MSNRINKTILSRGYFPKELPPAFNTLSFADFATSAIGRKAIEQYKPADMYTECCEFKVARTGDESRDFKIPHPYHFAQLTSLCSSNFKRLQLLSEGQRLTFRGTRVLIVVEPTIATIIFDFERLVHCSQHNLPKEKGEVITNRDTLAKLLVQVHEVLVHSLTEQLDVFPVFLLAHSGINSPAHCMGVEGGVKVTNIGTEEKGGRGSR